MFAIAERLNHEVDERVADLVGELLESFEVRGVRA